MCEILLKTWILSLVHLTLHKNFVLMKWSSHQEYAVIKWYFSERKLIKHLYSYCEPVWIARFMRLRSTFWVFFFFNAWTIKSHEFTVQRQKLLFTHCSSTVHIFKNIKNGSHNTIHTFKNYFATMFSVFSFSKNKFNPNEPIEFF